MARTEIILPLACLFLAALVPSEAQKGEADRETVVRVSAGAPLTVECRLRPEQRAEWRRDGGELPDEMRPVAEAPAPDGRLTARLRAAAARAHLAGTYTCTPERDQRVRVLVQPAQPTAGEASSVAPEERAGAAGAGAGAEGAPQVVFDVRSNITLRCELPNEGGLAYVWRKNGTALEEVWEMKERYQLEHGGAEFRVARAMEDDFGNYSCALAGQPQQQQWAVRGRPHLKLPANTNVVEGQKLKLICRVIGKPYPRVQWSYSNATEGAGAEAFTDVAALGARASLAPSEQGVPDGALVLEAAARGDAGRYRCAAPLAPAAALTTLRVKDMYAALWPFLGICAEVFVLCAIILVYEKRRTKPDLDDSDTDNHDQKKS